MYTLDNNNVTISGFIDGPFSYSHTSVGEAFYESYIRCQRLSTSEDVIPITVSDRLLDMSQDHTGKYVQIIGSFRSYNKKMENGHRANLVLHLFVHEIKVLDEVPEKRKDDNAVVLNGYLCKDPIYRITPLGRDIADMMLAVNRAYNHSDYIPCIAWGRNAKYAKSLHVGDHLKVVGRLQSRGYMKAMGGGSVEQRTAYEVSLNTLDLVFDEEEAEEAADTTEE